MRKSVNLLAFSPKASRIQVIMLLVVVLPCVPATTIGCFEGRIMVSSALGSDRKGIARVVGNALEVGKIPSVRQLVVVDDLIALVQRKNVADKIRSDKARASGDKELHRTTSRSPEARVGKITSWTLASASHQAGQIS